MHEEEGRGCKPSAWNIVILRSLLNISVEWAVQQGPKSWLQASPQKFHDWMMVGREVVAHMSSMCAGLREGGR